MIAIDSYHFFGEPHVRNAGVHRKLRDALCKRRRGYLWTPAHGVMFAPALSNRLYGDGRALLGLTTINSRPRFYVLRCDSAWSVGFDSSSADDAVDFCEYVDAVTMALESEFGCGRFDDGSGEKESKRDRDARRRWPALDDENGCSWWRISVPEVRGVRTVPHPYSPSIRILAP